MRASAGACNRYMALRFRALSWIILVCDFEILQDWAVGARVAMAFGSKPFERSPHRLKLLFLPPEFRGTG